MNCNKRNNDGHHRPNVLLLLVVIISTCVIQSSNAWIMGSSSPSFTLLSLSQRHQQQYRQDNKSNNKNQLFSSSTDGNEGIQTISLATLQNHEEDGQKMADSIVAWLDSEWIPQQVHIDMANSAKASYISCRMNENDDIMSIMMTVVDDLTENWMEKYDKDAFINAWDIGNYVSDYLIQVSGNEACDCSTPVY